MSASEVWEVFQALGETDWQKSEQAAAHEGLGLMLDVVGEQETPHIISPKNPTIII